MGKPSDRYSFLIPVGVLFVGLILYQSFVQLRRKQMAERRSISVATSTFSGTSGKFLAESVGLEADAGAMARLLIQGTQLPAAGTVTLGTAADNQPALQFHVVAGDEAIAGKDRSLGQFVSAPLKPAPKGALRIEVTFAVSPDGALTITSKELSTGSTRTMTFGPVHVQ